MKTILHGRTNRVHQPVVEKHIAFVCFSHSLGGLELTTLRLAEATSARGNRVLVVVPPGSPLQQRASKAGLNVAPIEPRWKYGDVFAAHRLSQVLRMNEIEVAVLMQSKDLHLASLASLLFKSVKSVFYQQMDSGYDKRDPLHRWVHSKLALWLSLTSGMRNNVLKFTRMAGGKVDVVPLGIDLHQFDPKKYAKATARQFFHLTTKGRLIGVLGRLDPQKGQEVLMRALPAIAKKHRDVHLVIAGDETAGEPGYKAYLEKLCTTLAIQDRVVFLPFTNDVPRLMAALDIFVLPSYCETYGLVVIEAMAMNCPVVATNAGGVPEIIENGRTGLLVPPRDVEGLSRALEELLTHTALRSKLKRSARLEASRRFDFNQTVDGFLHFVTTLYNPAPRP